MLYVHVLVFFASLGGFLFGYNTSVISGALLQLENDFSLTTMWKQGLVSATVGSAAVFSLVSGFLNSFVGRRALFLTSSFAFICGALSCALAPNKQVLLVGRVIQGIGIGLVSTTSPLYISEIAPLKSRGRWTTVNTLFLTGGQFFAGVAGGIFITFAQGWRFMFALSAFPAALQFIAFLFLPESPRWLLSQDRWEEARVVLTQIRDAEGAEKELDSMLKDRVKVTSAANGLILSKMLRSPTARRALLVGCGLQMIQQVIGINTVMYYSASVIKLSGVSSLSSAAWLSALVASINFLFTIVGVYFVERAGRRRLTLFSLFGVTASLALLAASFQISAMTSPDVTTRVPIIDNDNNTNSYSDHQRATSCAHMKDCDSCTRNPECGFCFLNVEGTIGESSCLPFERGNASASASAAVPCSIANSTRNDGDDGSVLWTTDSCPSSYSWMATGGMVIYLAFFAPGMGPMPWTINAEIYPSWARSAGNGLATFTNWIFNLLISTTFLSLIEILTPSGAFWVYCGLSALGFLFVYLTLPETRKKSLEEIENLFEEKKT